MEESEERQIILLHLPLDTFQIGKWFIGDKLDVFLQSLCSKALKWGRDVYKKKAIHESLCSFFSIRSALRQNFLVTLHPEIKNQIIRTEICFIFTKDSISLRRTTSYAISVSIIQRMVPSVLSRLPWWHSLHYCFGTCRLNGSASRT